MKNEKAYLLLSGGPDSSTLAYELVKDYQVHCIFVDFGQHFVDHELAAARRTACNINSPLEAIDISGLRRSLLGLNEHNSLVIINGGSRARIIEGIVGIATTFVRYAGGRTLYNASIKDDLEEIPGLAEFFHAFQKSIRCLPDGETFKLESPYLTLSKANVFERARKLNVPLAGTWSCLGRGDVHCGVCRGCTKRKKAFAAARIKDATTYLR